MTEPQFSSSGGSPTTQAQLHSDNLGPSLLRRYYTCDVMVLAGLMSAASRSRSRTPLEKNSLSKHTEPSGQTLVAETKRDADRCAPEFEVAQADVEIVVRLVVLKRPQVADIAAETHVVVEEAVDAPADVQPEGVGI